MDKTRTGRIEEAYRRANPTAARCYEAASRVIPGGVTHDLRALRPFPVYVDRAEGPYKWTVDGTRLVDWWMGHGALFLGHGHPAVREAVHAQLEKGTHYAACHPLEARWAEKVVDLVPCAEMVRFVNSGTEAVQLAVRIARAATGRPKFLRLEGHFHGWHDEAFIGSKPPYDWPASAGIAPSAHDGVIVVPPNEPAAVEHGLAAADIAAVILEPAGGSSGTVPVAPGYLASIRRAADRTGTLVIFDEVISGFRFAPGGAQAFYGVRPDLVVLAKILAGGFPGGAVAGSRQLMEAMALRDDAIWNRRYRVAQGGTFNANPVSAAAGIATLALLEDGSLQKQASTLADMLRIEINDVALQTGADMLAYGEASLCHLLFKPVARGISADRLTSPGTHHRLQDYSRTALQDALRCALITEGVDFPIHYAWVSAAHTEEHVELTVKGLKRAIQATQAEGLWD